MFHADLIIKNANILTMDKRLEKASALAASFGRIIGVGAEKDFDTLEGPETTVIHANGQTALPGFNDSHAHPIYSGACLELVDLSGVRSLSEFFAALRVRASKTPRGEWVEGFGYDEGLFAQGREPTIEEMDQAVPDHPLYCARACLHAGIANSMAFRLAGFSESTPNPQGGEFAKSGGKLTGRLLDAASFMFKAKIPLPSTERLVRMFGENSRILNSYGITSTSEMGMIGIPYAFNLLDLIVKRREQSVRLAVYLDEPHYSNFASTNLPAPLGDEMLRLQGRKIILDGGGGSGTARVSEPNLHDGKTGLLYFTQDQLDDLTWQAHSRGHQVCAHAIGDIAIGMLLKAYRKALEKLPAQRLPLRIEHASFCFPPLLEELRGLGAAATLNPGFIYYFGKTHLRNYGLERVSKEIPLKSMLDMGTLAAIGSDAPVTSANPFPIIYSAITRKTADGIECGREQSAGIYEALFAYTAAGAFLTGEEREKGTLSPGKLADIAMLDGDPLSMGGEPERILEIKATRTILGGKTVFENI
ncbi:MAG: amidohydrolase [Clostridiales bacterium]|nr:amidohydrolase [Clostridiales bacterium]